MLKHDETFVVLDRYGDIHPVGLGQLGLYHDATRFLSRLELRIDGGRPLLLSSTVTEDNTRVTVDLTNRELRRAGERGVPQDAIHVFRSVVLWDGTCHQRLLVRSYALEPIHFDLTLSFAADFADIFEVRGTERERRGEAAPPWMDGREVVIAYRGLDDLERRTRLRLDPSPAKLERGQATFSIELDPGVECTLAFSAACEVGGAPRPELAFETARAAASEALAARRGPCRIETTNERFNDWLNRSAADLHMMLTDTPQGTYPYAGVPWFSAPFGRDGLVTALQTLWLEPAIAAAVLRFLAHTQASARDDASDAEPGKILHEARGGEMSALGEVPFRRYYGTVDATPLFVVLAHAYHERTGDHALAEEIWPHVTRALEWIDGYGDRDGDGFVEYLRRTPEGLANQGWKDSRDSVFHEDGRLAEGPIALCEVQGYVYAAWCGAAALADVLGDPQRARELRRRARGLQERFEAHYWLPDQETYALALDGEKRPCRVRSSNAGHALWTGIARREHAEAVARTLMVPESFSGWGVRTLATTERRFNPMSYHNGSVWPHDNAILAAGLARYGFRAPALRILTGLFDASLFAELHRMPELFCGFPRRPGEGPTTYPVACAPQSWAAGAVYMLFQACLGLEIRQESREILFRSAVLPPFLEGVRLRGLRVGDGEVDLDLVRHPEDVGMQVVRRSGRVTVVAVK